MGKKTKLGKFIHIDFGTNAGGVQNVISVNEDGDLICRDIQSKAVNTVIADSAAEMRLLNSNLPKDQYGNPDAQGYIAARIPITIWTNWRREWDKKYRAYFSWQAYELMMINSPEFAEYRCVPGKVSVGDDEMMRMLETERVPVTA